MLNIESITKAYGAQTLFRDATFLVGDQARVGIVGPNGAGKTTFFRILMGDEHLDSGQIRKPKHYRIAMMQQEWAPHGHDTVLEATLREHRPWFAAREKLRHLEGSLGNEPDAKLLAEYEQVEAEYSSLGGYNLEQMAEELLTGLGFNADQLGQPCKELSGGWRIRVHLAGLLLQQSDLLLLDEPTNHLDVESVVWFEDFLRSYPHSVLMISHDRRLIERFATEILEFSPPTLTLWPGGLKAYESQKAARTEQLESEVANKEREIEHLMEFVNRFGAKATKARQAQSRLKSVDVYKRQIQDLKANMPVVSKRPSRFHLVPKRRVPRVVFDMEHGALGYEKSRPLFAIDRCAIEGGRKIGVIGVNGVGKSTFLKCVSGELEPLSGIVKRNENISIGYFAQHRMEELASNVNAFDYLYEQNPGSTMPEVRGVAAVLGLSANDLDKKMDVLSGGEKARVSLARILLSKPELLLLDEPTNHLDIEACDALVRGLATYEGTVLVVSHNRDFLDSLVNMILEIRGGQAHFHHGTYSDWLSRHSPVAQSKSVPNPNLPTSTYRSKEQRRLDAQERDKKSQLQKAHKKLVADAEKELQAKSAEQAELDAFLCLPEAPKHPEFHSKLRLRARLATEIESIEARWLELAEKAS